MAWQIAQPLIQGNPGSNTYPYDITGLAPNTNYAYRAQISIGANTYYGEIFYGTTTPVATILPSITTGNADIPLTTSFNVVNSVLTSVGTGPILEYGILYVQSSSYEVVYEDWLAGNVNKVVHGVSDPLSLPSTFTDAITGLLPNKQTFFRAYARNATGISYGVKRSATTAAIAVDTCLFRTLSGGINDSTGCLCFNPALTVGQNATLNIYMEQCVLVAGSATSTLLCRPNGSPTYNSILALSTTAAQISDSRTISVPMLSGDALCYIQRNTGNVGSFSTIWLNGIPTHSADINPTIDLVFYCDRIHT